MTRHVERQLHGGRTCRGSSPGLLEDRSGTPSGERYRSRAKTRACQNPGSAAQELLYSLSVAEPLDAGDRLDLQRLAASLVLDHDFRSHVAVAKAADLVAKGIVGAATIDLASQPSDPNSLRRADIEPLFRSMLAELGISMPEPDQAGWAAARWIAEMMIAGAIDPAVGALRLWGLWDICGAPDDELTWMLQLHDAWEESVGTERAAVEREILAYAPVVVAAADRRALPGYRGPDSSRAPVIGLGGLRDRIGGWRLVEVPPEDAPLKSIFRFASSTYFGYERHGGVEGLRHLANAVATAWTNGGRLPGDLATLRAALFLESRRWHHLGSEPDPAAEAYVRGLVARIHQVSGGSVRTDHEGPVMWLRRGINHLRGSR